jgi:hypothetical protein
MAFDACSESLGFCGDDDDACGDGLCGNIARNLTWKEEHKMGNHSRQVELMYIVIVGAVVKTVALAAVVVVTVAIVAEVKEMM